MCTAVLGLLKGAQRRWVGCKYAKMGENCAAKPRWWGGTGQHAGVGRASATLHFAVPAGAQGMLRAEPACNVEPPAALHVSSTLCFLSPIRAVQGQQAGASTSSDQQQEQQQGAAVVQQVGEPAGVLVDARRGAFFFAGDAIR